MNCYEHTLIIKQDKLENHSKTIINKYEDLINKLDPNPDLIFVDNYMFPNGSMYKG